MNYWQFTDNFNSICVQTNDTVLYLDENADKENIQTTRNETSDKKEQQKTVTDDEDAIPTD